MPRRKMLRGGLLLATLATMLVAGQTPAVAARPSVGPETPVASDGSTVTAAPVNTRARAGGEAGWRGTDTVPATSTSAPDGDSDTALGPESIIGPDNRIRITPTTSFPARAVVMISRNGNAHCSGWLYGPDIVATAGHCVHSGGTGGTWYSGLAVWPGRDGSSAPYGSCTVRTLYSVTGWTSSRNEQYDYGALKLNCTIGNTTGWFGYWWQSASLSGTSTLVSGYPGDKPLGQQWRGDNVSRTVAVTQTEQIFYSNDTIGGMSGSAVYQYRASGSSYCTGYCSMAIHAYGLHAAYPHSSYNHGTRITQAKFNNLQSWKAAA